MKPTQVGLWSVILAGGDGKRLLPLTSRLAGDARPKQFCAILGGETLLECTRRRADLVCRFDRQVVVVSRRHEAHYEYLARELAPGRLVIQPGNCDTGPGIVYPLFRVAELAGAAPVVILPSDHYVSDDARFMEHVQGAVDLVRALPETVVLLGIRATSPETDSGWIEANETPLLQGEGMFQIRGFWEKPSPAMARWLLARGGLWNSFVIVGGCRDCSISSRRRHPRCSPPLSRCGARSARHEKRPPPKRYTRRCHRSTSSPCRGSRRPRQAGRWREAHETTCGECCVAYVGGVRASGASG